MTVTATQSASAGTTGTGRVSRVIGPVVDIEFPADAMPKIYGALHVDVTMSGVTRTLTLEVALHIGDSMEMDLHGARAAGFKALQIRRGAATPGPDHLQSMSGLPERL